MSTLLHLPIDVTLAGPPAECGFEEIHTCTSPNGEHGLDVRIVRERQSATTLVELVGELDQVTGSALSAAMSMIGTRTHGPRIIVDLTGLRFLAACGVAILHAATADSTRQGRRLVAVVGPTGPVASIVIRTLRGVAGLPVRSTVVDARCAPLNGSTPEVPVAVASITSPGRP